MVVSVVVGKTGEVVGEVLVDAVERTIGGLVGLGVGVAGVGGSL